MAKYLNEPFLLSLMFAVWQCKNTYCFHCFTRILFLFRDTPSGAQCCHVITVVNQETGLWSPLLCWSEKITSRIIYVPSIVSLGSSLTKGPFFLDAIDVHLQE